MKTLTIDGIRFEIVDELARSKGEGVFIADYDTTTFAEIKAAHDAGKVCFVRSEGMPVCPLLGIADGKAIFIREINDTTDYKITFTSAGGKDFTLVDKNTPIYVAQTLTDDQKAQARTNIGAMSTGDVNTVLQQAKDSGKFDGKDGEDGYTPVKGKDYFDGYTPVKGKDYFDGANGKTAYAYAQDGGYTGTETEFAKKLASDSDSVFVADYDTTTYAEVKAAHNAGKVCFVKSDGMPFCQLLGIDDSEAIFIREINDTTDYKVTFTSAGGKDFTLVEKNTPIYIAQTLSDAQKAQARTNIGAASASHAHSADNITSGVLPLARGGTGRAMSRTNNAIIRFSGSSDYFSTTATASGAMYATSANGAPVFGTLPIAQGGTGATDAATARSNIGAAAVADLSNYVTTGTAQTITGVKTFNAPANVAGTEQHTVKFKTSNGGAIIFGKEAANSGTMLRFDQVDGTTRLRFRGSATAGAIVWEQPEQGAQLYVDLGKQGVDKHRITFPSSTGTLALTSQIPSLSGYLPLSGGLMTGSLKFQAASLPGKSLQYVCGVDAFGNGGEMGWQSKADFLSGYLTTTGTAARATADANGNNIASTYLPKSGGTLTGNLTVGSAKIQTNGYVIGTWLQTTAGNASSSAMSKVCVQSPDGWIYTRTLDQLRNDMNAASKNEVIEAANGSLKVTLSGNASSGYKIDKTFAQIQSAWNAGRKVYLYNGNVFNLNHMQEDFMAVFTSIILSNNSVSIQSATILASDSSVFSFETKTL